MEREHPELQRERHDWNIHNAEEVVPDGWRLTYPESKLDVPQSWVFKSNEGLLVIDPGGELPIESASDHASLRGVARTIAGSPETPKINAVRELEQKYDAEVSGILLTHGDADHHNNIEQVSDDTMPVFVGKRGHWAVLSPEKQFTATRVNMDKSELTDYRSSKTLLARDVGFQASARFINNPRSTIVQGPHRAAKKREFAKRLQDFPESFETDSGQLEVVPLPGHAPEEVGFYLANEKLMIVGDLIGTSKPDQADRINLFLAEANVYDAIDSLKRLQEIEIERLYPAHGPPLIGQESIHAHLETLIHAAESLIGRINDMHAQHPDATVQELSQLVFTKDWARRGLVVQSQESWIFSALRDRPNEKEKE